VVLLFPFSLLLVGWISGRVIERRHYQSIHARERRFLTRPAVTLKTLPDDRPVASASLAVGSVVVASDYFRNFAFSFRKLIGGEVRAYASLLDRARREALLRMKESCPTADLYLACRLETSDISGSASQGVTGAVEVLAYATAIRYASEAQA
jgi:uncharacterized protein YbjQ (UPF0145 family)